MHEPLASGPDSLNHDADALARFVDDAEPADGLVAIPRAGTASSDPDAVDPALVTALCAFPRGGTGPVGGRVAGR
jgi:hypothetical protein